MILDRQQRGCAPLERHLSSYAQLTDEQVSALRAHLGPATTWSPHELGPTSGPPLVLASGWAATAALFDNGRRQLVSLFIAGDIIEPAVDCDPGLSLVALKPCRVLDGGDLFATLSARAGEPKWRPLGRAWLSARHGVRTRLASHLVRLGGLSAYERMAAFLSEMHGRQLRAGLTDAGTLTLPLSQDTLADHLGLSLVHVNRTIQQLRRDRLIAWRSGAVQVLQAAALERAGRPSARRTAAAADLSDAPRVAAQVSAG
jgi:CRP-like cAMP-binding protein